MRSRSAVIQTPSRCRRVTSETSGYRKWVNSGPITLKYVNEPISAWARVGGQLQDHQRRQGAAADRQFNTRRLRFLNPARLHRQVEYPDYLWQTGLVAEAIIPPSRLARPRTSRSPFRTRGGIRNVRARRGRSDLQADRRVGVEACCGLREELVSKTYRPDPVRRAIRLCASFDGRQSLTRR